MATGRHWAPLDLKEHFISIGLGLLPAYWVCWRRPLHTQNHTNDAPPLTTIFCLHRLVELSHRSRHEQHQGLWVMMSAAAFRGFAFAYGIAFAVLYVVALARDLALFTVYPSFGIILLGTHPSKDHVDPAIGFVAVAIYWYGWTATAAIGDWS